MSVMHFVVVGRCAAVPAIVFLCVSPKIIEISYFHITDHRVHHRSFLVVAFPKKTKRFSFAGRKLGRMVVHWVTTTFKRKAHLAWCCVCAVAN